MISLTYSLISPLILFFSAFTFGAFYLAYKHNFIYVYSLQTSTMGLLFPRALQQTMVGLYFLEVCMIGLVSVGKSFGSIVLMVIALIATIFFHLRLNHAFGYLVQVVPIDAASHRGDVDPEEMTDMAYANQRFPNRKPVNTSLAPAVIGSRDSDDDDGDMENDLKRRELTGRGSSDSSNDGLPSYTHAALTARCPSLWIPTDSLGVSSSEIERTRSEAKVTVQDSGSYIDEKGNLTWDKVTAPYDYNPHARDIEL